MTATLRVVAWLLLVLVAVVGAQDLSSSPAGEEAAAAAAPAAGETRAASDDSGPQTRFFLPGVSNFVNNIFNPCSRCNAGDQQFANRCCQTGERQCCFVLQPFPGQFGGGGFGQGGFGQGGFGPGGFGQGGFGQGGFGQGGFGPGGFGQGGFGHGHGGGFNQGGFGGGFQQGGFGGGFNNFQQNIKPGFCSKPGLFGGLFSRSNADAPSDSPVGLRSLPGGSPSTETGTEGSPTEQSAQEGRSGRRARQAPEDPAAPASDDSQPSTRFLPNPFGPGPLIQNPFCRDECFNDFDCPGNLKCCLRDCRKCFNPSFS